MQRLHEPLGRDFTPDAEAVADLALVTPSVKARDVKFSILRENVSTIEIGGKTAIGYFKGSDEKTAAIEIFTANLGTLLGAPTAPCLEITDCEEREPDYCKANQPNWGLFSAQPFERIRYKRDIDNKIPYSADPVSLSAAGQFRAWIRDTDSYDANFVLNADNNAICLYDHEFSEPAGGIGTDSRNILFIGKSWRHQDPVNRERFATAADLMAKRIYGLPEKSLLQLTESLDVFGIKVPSEHVVGLVERKDIFKTSALVHSLRHLEGLKR